MRDVEVTCWVVEDSQVDVVLKLSVVEGSQVDAELTLSVVDGSQPAVGSMQWEADMSAAEC